MIRFILNNELVQTGQPPGGTVLDHIRYHKRLTGTKIGCREGDCGACTILVGDTVSGVLTYRSMTACLMPLGNANGKHIVTVEGINMKELSPVQQAMADANGTQCGFCTIGFVMSLTGFVLNENAKDHGSAIASMDGNICRCTGYKSIERAASAISLLLTNKPSQETIAWLVENNFIPSYFLQIKERLQQVKEINDGDLPQSNGNDRLMIAGGTDLVVQKALAVKRSAVRLLFDDPLLKNIIFENNRFHIGASVTVTAFAESELIQDSFPGLAKYIRLVSSTPIRNMATLAGNLVNASPIGDMSVFLLALDATIVISDGNRRREIRLKDLYKGYKQIDKGSDEYIESVIFSPPGKNDLFNFEKVSKRTHLDIASVNTACLMKLNDDGSVNDIHLSAGGVAPYPKYLARTAAFLKGKKIGAGVLKEAIEIMNSEIAPISDARGTAAYKQLLLRQLFLAHFSNDKGLIKKTIGMEN